MDQFTHVSLAHLLRNTMTHYVVNGTGTILGVYRDAPAYTVVPMNGIREAFGPSAHGSGGAIQQQLERVAAQVAAGEVSDETAGLVGLGFILEIVVEDGPTHVLTGVFTDQTVHRISWSRDEAIPTGVIVLPGTVDLTEDPFVAGLTAILQALTGGESQ